MTNKTPEELAEEYNMRREQETMHEGRGLSPFVYERIERIAGFLAGYESGRPKWVSVDQVPPNKRQTYLVASKVLSEPTLWTWCRQNWAINVEDSRLGTHKDITHYQPLPTPPTKED